MIIRNTIARLATTAVSFSFFTVPFSGTATFYQPTAYQAQQQNQYYYGSPYQNPYQNPYQYQYPQWPYQFPSMYPTTTPTTTPSGVPGSGAAGWADDSIAPSRIAYVNGPGNPPLGFGSAQFTVDSSGSSAAQLRNGRYDGVRLTSISELTYWTYVPMNYGGQNVYVVLNVDRDNNGSTDDMLTFEPRLQNNSSARLSYSSTTIPTQCGSSSCVAAGQWQQWNARTGGWWSWADSGSGRGLATLGDYQARYPSAVVRNGNGSNKGGVRMIAGMSGAGNWAGFVGNVTAVSIGVNGQSTTYRLEPAGNPGGGYYNQPASKDACKRGGYGFFGFRNQGQCVSTVNHMQQNYGYNSYNPYGQYGYGYGSWNQYMGQQQGQWGYDPYAQGYGWYGSQQGYYPYGQVSYYSQPAMNTGWYYGSQAGYGSPYGQYAYGYGQY